MFFYYCNSWFFLCFFSDSFFEANIFVSANIGTHGVFSVVTDNSLTFSNLTLENLSNSPSISGTFHKTVTSNLTITYNSTPGSYCTYDIVYIDNGDPYSKVYYGNGYVATDDFYIDWSYNGTGDDAYQSANAGKTFSEKVKATNINCYKDGEYYYRANDPLNSNLEHVDIDTLIDSMLKNEYGVDNVNEAKTLINQKTAPNFDDIATTNEGIFKTVDDDGDVYYYRGSVNNNHVIFGNFYLYNGIFQWYFSPYFFDNGNACVWTLTSYGALTVSVVYGSIGLRPVVSLKPGAGVSGGNGTSNTLYIIAAG